MLFFAKKSNIFFQLGLNTRLEWNLKSAEKQSFPE